MQKTAVISECGLYRYHLTRTWDATKARLGFIMLNPSTADAEVDDPTIRRCIGFAKQWNYGGIEVVNLFALRATDPTDLKDSREAGIRIVGDRNDFHIHEMAKRCEVVIAAWGANHTWGRAEEVIKDFPSILYHLGLTKDGHPRHPLYLPYSALPEVLA